MDDPTLVKRFAALEAQLRLISEKLDIPCPPFPTQTGPAQPGGLPAEVVELAEQGHATRAVARLRELTGASLLEAKRAVDAL